MKTVAIVKELRRIAAQHGGMLQPEDVVEAARSPKSILHNRFTWDNTEAARQWRLHEARNLIRVTVEVIPGTTESAPVFVSLSTDRNSEGGYRAMATVMTDNQMREQLLADALADLNVFQQKYRRLRELAGIFAELKKLKQAA